MTEKEKKKKQLALQKNLQTKKGKQLNSKIKLSKGRIAERHA